MALFWSKTSREIVGTTADVLFYVLPPCFTLSIQMPVRERLRNILLKVSGDGEVSSTIVAHSQGTVVAHDVLKSGQLNVTNFVAGGSPLGALYARFLSIKPGGLRGGPWFNCFRLSDFIGGPIGSPEISDVTIRGGYRKMHFDYFGEPEFMRFVLINSGGNVRQPTMDA